MSAIFTVVNDCASLSFSLREVGAGIANGARSLYRHAGRTRLLIHSVRSTKAVKVKKSIPVLDGLVKLVVLLSGIVAA